MSAPTVASAAADLRDLIMAAGTTIAEKDSLLQAATRLNADLIVIGSHGHGGWDRILATNAARVADFSDRNVLIVHDRPAS